LAESWPGATLPPISVPEMPKNAGEVLSAHNLLPEEEMNPKTASQLAKTTAWRQLRL
jgi:hypothetical protein